MDLSEHTSLAGIAEAIAVVQAAALEVGADIFVTGAFARDLWLTFGHDIDVERETRDLDFGVECADWETFEKIARLLESRGLDRDERKQERLRHPNGTEIDLIPFGGVERPDRTIAWPPGDNPVMNLVGFAEVVRAAVPVTLPGVVTVQVIPLPALALLKLLAWEDRRLTEARDKDAQDLVLIAKHYLDVREPAISIEERAELVERYQFKDEFAGAELLGSDMAAFGSEAVRIAVERILEREGGEAGSLELARVVSRYDPVAALGFVAALLRGFAEKRGA
ncbi:MAG: nucleotidyl transferase AbiEii/AbiGii toxin family protein [Thermoanaerobaculia bacterium]